MKIGRNVTALASIAALAVGSAAWADSIGGYAGVESGTPANEDGPVVLLDWSFNLPELVSLDSVELELAADYGSDLHVTLVGPDSTAYNLVTGQGTTSLGPSEYDAFGPFDGGFDATPLGDGGGYLLDNVVNYTLASSGDAWLGGDFDEHQPEGTYAAEEMPVGASAAGEWRLIVLDTWPSLDESALGNYAVNYTAVPAPGALALLGVAGLVGARRRRK